MKASNVRIVHGATVGLPAEGSLAWVRLEVESLAFHGTQSRYNGERAAKSARWLRDHPDCWYDPANELHRFDSWYGFVRAVCSLDPAWADFLIQNETTLSGDYAKDRAAHAEAVRRDAEERKALTLAAPAGRTPDEVLALQVEGGKRGGAIAGRGRPKKRERVGDIVTDPNGPERGNAAPYLAGRLKRDHPEIARKLQAGEFPSVRAAAKAAGIVRDPTPLELLQKAWRKASPKERAAFLEEVGP